MLDSPARVVVRKPLAKVAATIDRPWVTPDRITLVGLGLGLAGAFAASGQLWLLALALWIASRVADGLDGALARRRVRRGLGRTSGAAGGFLDITADFVVYGSFVVGVAVGSGGDLLPFLLVLLAYYINGTAFLAFSSIAERTGRQREDGRSLSFLGGLAEGTETIIVHSLWCIVPMWAGSIAWGWAAIVFVSAGQRILAGYRALRGTDSAAPQRSKQV
jgi:phosphatidylglycerophosphate synthase